MSVLCVARRVLPLRVIPQFPTTRGKPAVRAATTAALKPERPEEPDPNVRPPARCPPQAAAYGAESVLCSAVAGVLRQRVPVLRLGGLLGRGSSLLGVFPRFAHAHGRPAVAETAQLQEFEEKLRDWKRAQRVEAEDIDASAAAENVPQ